MKKAEWKARALAAEAQLRAGPPLTFQTLSIDFPTRTIWWHGRKITVETDGLSLPIVQVANALERRGMEA
jgi:hypothetical protein